MGLICVCLCIVAVHLGLIVFILPSHCCGPPVHLGLRFLGLMFALVLPFGDPCGFDCLVLPMHCCGPSGFDLPFCLWSTCFVSDFAPCGFDCLVLPMHCCGPSGFDLPFCLWSTCFVSDFACTLLWPTCPPGLEVHGFDVCSCLAMLWSMWV